MTLAWVLGRGGLLGQALTRTLLQQDVKFFCAPYPISWNDPSWWLWQFNQGAKNLAQQLQPGQPWIVYWAAGLGTMSSSAEDMAKETQALKLLLDALDQQASLSRAPGTVVLASSAGALHANPDTALVTEDSPPTPNTAYGHAKLVHEALLREWASRAPDRLVLLARLSSLYGPGQAWGKKQGLISHMARSLLRQQPVHIYVPLGTLRDYVYADDAAQKMAGATHRLDRAQPIHCRLICSERAVSVAEIMATFTRLTRRAPRIVTSVARASALYPARVVFRSLFQAAHCTAHLTSLPVGISRVLESERQLMAHGPKPEVLQPAIPVSEVPVGDG